MKALDIRKGMIGKELNRERRHWIELTAGGEGPELPNPGNLFLWNDNTTPFFYVKPNNINLLILPWGFGFLWIIFSVHFHFNSKRQLIIHIIPFIFYWISPID